MNVDTPTLGSASVELKEKYKSILRKLLTAQRSYLLKVKKQMGDKTAQVPDLFGHPPRIEVLEKRSNASDTSLASDTHLSYSLCVAKPIGLVDV